MTAQDADPVLPVIPAHFGRLRRWWYAHYPLRTHQICPATLWRHDFKPIQGTWGEAVCVCEQQAFVEYGA